MFRQVYNTFCRIKGLSYIAINESLFFLSTFRIGLLIIFLQYECYVLLIEYFYFSLETAPQLKLGLQRKEKNRPGVHHMKQNQ